MHRFLPIVLLIASCLPSLAEAQQSRPEDGHLYHVCVFTADRPDATGQQLLRWFSDPVYGDPRLVQLAANSHWHHYTPADPVYRSRFAKFVPPTDLPAVWIQGGNDGRIIYKASGKNVPSSASELLEQIDYYATHDPFRWKESSRSVPDSASYYGKLVNTNTVTANMRGQCIDGQCDPNGLPSMRPLDRIADTAELVTGKAGEDLKTVAVFAGIGLIGAVLLGTAGVVVVVILIAGFVFFSRKAS